MRYPGIVDSVTQEIGKRCEVCTKVFAGPDYLLAHYKRRHASFYLEEIRPKEDQNLKQELG